MILILGIGDYQINRDCSFFLIIFLTKLQDYLRISKGQFFKNRIGLFTKGCTENEEDFLKLFASVYFI